MREEIKMISYRGNFAYVLSDDARLFTVSLLPCENGKFPVVIIRTPYLDKYVNCDETDIALDYLNEYKNWLKAGYAIVLQHCRGKGKSEGECIPFINERKDGLNLQKWIREQEFYNGEIFLLGASYLSSVHYSIT